MDLLIILLIICALGGVGTGPWMGYSHYGWAPTGGFGLVFLVLLVMLIMRPRG